MELYHFVKKQSILQKDNFCLFLVGFHVYVDKSKGNTPKASCFRGVERVT